MAETPRDGFERADLREAKVGVGRFALVRIGKEAPVTREHKLALIVGFSLVLLVGVLIADHLSLARRAEIAPVGERELSIAQAPTKVMDPLRTIEHQLAAQTPLDPAPQQQAAMPAVPPLMPTEPEIQSTPENFAPQAAPVEPVHIAQGRSTLATNENADTELLNTARSMGWEPRIENDTVVLTQTVQEPIREPLPANTPAPAPIAAKQAEPIKTYTVQKGDSFYKIAQKHYGDGNLWKALVKFNGGDEVARLGATVKIPSIETLTGKPTLTAKPALEKKLATQPPAAPKPEPKKTTPAPAKPSRIEIAALTYTVKRGDTLGEIAQRTLGTSRRWREIADLNKIKDVDVIPAGTVLKLPPMRG